MYKVFINEAVLVFTDAPSAQSQKFTGKEQLKSSINALEKGLTHQVILQVPVPEKAFAAFQENYQIIEAAGGAVFNAQNQLLMIHRLGKWDLPKGKLEEGEAIEIAAVREVEEECGISKPVIERALPNTYHTYTLKGQAILKRTYWFKMSYQGQEELVPQGEEDIRVARWCSAAEVEENLQNTYGNIKALWQSLKD